MMNRIKQPIGSFEARSAERLPETVIVSQETRLDCEDLVIAARKVFTLGTVAGEEIFRADEPHLFRKKDGTVLNKVGYCRMCHCSGS